jgi:glutathione S-transferase
MDLYFSPLACSMATRIALYEAGADARFHYVDGKTKKLEDGSDYLKINPIGQVPALKTPDGQVMTQNPVILLAVADAYPKLAPRDNTERTELMQWLNFITSELHKVVFTPLLDPTSNDGARQYAREKAVRYLGHLNTRLEGRELLLDRFTVADAYLFTVLNWGRATGMNGYAEYPAIAAYFTKLQQRPSVAKAFAEEFALYGAEQERRKRAA